VTLDDRYANKFAPLDSTAIYPKLGQALLYSTFDWWNEMPYKYTFVLHIPFHLLRLLCHTSIQPPSSSNDEQWSSIYVANHDTLTIPHSMKLLHHSSTKPLDHQHKLTLSLIFHEWYSQLHSFTWPYWCIDQSLAWSSPSSRSIGTKPSTHASLPRRSTAPKPLARPSLSQLSPS